MIEFNKKMLYNKNINTFIILISMSSRIRKFFQKFAPRVSDNYTINSCEFMV